MEGNKNHEALYEGAHRGDTWTLPENFELNPRGRAVEMVRAQFEGPVSVLDIGCGKGINTAWIADQNDGSSWTGIDVVSKETIGLDIPDDAQHQFIEGDILSEEFQKKNEFENKKFDIIVDQGAVFVTMDDPSEVENYLKLASRLLNEKGIFLVLTVIGRPQVAIFPDGRKRVIRSAEDFQNEPFSTYFELEEGVKQNPFAYYGHSFLPEDQYKNVDLTTLSPEARKLAEDLKNPLGAKMGDPVQLQIAQIPLRKKSSPLAK